MGEVQRLRDDLLELDRQVRRLRTQMQQVSAGDLGRADAVVGVIPSGNVPAHGSIGRWTNQSGGARSKGIVVVANGDRTFDVTTNVGDLDVIGVVIEDGVADTAEGRVRHQGYQPSVIVEGAVVAGQFLRSSATAGAAEDAGAARTAGSFALALTAAAGPGAGTVAAYLFGTVSHTKYTDAEAVAAVEAADPLSLAGEVTMAKDFFFLGNGSGLPYGHMYGHNMAETVGVAAADTWYEITAGLSGGEVNLQTFQNNHELKVAKAGRYLITWSMALHTGTANDEVEGTVAIGGTANVTAASHATIARANSDEAIAGTTILDLAADDLVSLAILNHSAIRDIVVEHVTCTVVMVGGT